MVFQRLFGFAIVCGLAIPTAPISAAGFDCSRATTPSEIAICANPDLGMMDQALNIVWRSGPKSAQNRTDQTTWLGLRDACSSNRTCLAQAYKLQLEQLDPDLGVVDVISLHDSGQNVSVLLLVSRATYGGYNGQSAMYYVTGAELVPVPWIIPLFDERARTCDVMILDGANVQMTQAGDAPGWAAFKFEMDDDQVIVDGEVSLFRKWVGHGDQSEYVIYRLMDGAFRPNRALVDNCADQQSDYATVFFE